MALYDLPNEIIIEIGKILENEQDIAFLTRVNWRFYHLFNEYLYCYNVRNRRSGALSWAAKNSRESTARRLLHLGANVNVKMREVKFSGGRPITGLTPLHSAALKGHLPMVKLLLEVGADPEARVDEGFTPLYFAIINRHEKIARTISRRMSNLQDCLVDLKRRLTPLHLSCRLGLYGYARYFLEKGADEILETVKLLLRFEADQTYQRPPRSRWERPTTARQCGENHPYERVRGLFSDGIGFLPNASEHKLHTLRIGRTWIYTSELSGAGREGVDVANHLDDEHFVDDQHGVQMCDGDVIQPEGIDMNSFPALNNANRSPNSRFTLSMPDGLWSTSNVKPLIAGFSRPGGVQSLLTPEQEVRVDPFPYLSSHVPKNFVETEAGKLWTGLEKPNRQPSAGYGFRGPTGMEKNSPPGTERKKTGGKKKWQPLKL